MSREGFGGEGFWLVVGVEMVELVCGGEGSCDAPGRLGCAYTVERTLVRVLFLLFISRLLLPRSCLPFLPFFLMSILNRRLGGI